MRKPSNHKNGTEKPEISYRLVSLDESPCVLIVEDDSAMARGLRYFAEKACRAVLVPSLAEAHRRLAETAFSALIIDVSLPDGSGVDLLREVRQRSKVPVLVLTGSEDRRLVNEVQALRAEFVFKPVEPENIVRFLEQALLRHPDPRHRLRSSARAFARKFGLTTHETLVLELIVEGASRDAITASLEIAPSTLKTHVKHILFKTRCAKLDELVRILLEKAVIGNDEITQLSGPPTTTGVEEL